MAEPMEREEQSLAANIWAFAHGASVVRVHEVSPVIEYLRLVEAMRMTRRS